MTHAAAATSISELGTVFVPVTDQDRALAFYVDMLGFEKRADFTYGQGRRWIEVAPPSSSNVIALVPLSEGRTVGGDETICAFTSEDIEADHAALREHGVDVDSEIARPGEQRRGVMTVDITVRDPLPPQFFFRDPDGNRFLIVEQR
jgi:catechol 2,3-dioxygenase-like lactoylglutathione lyase family enzyme